MAREFSKEDRNKKGGNAGLGVTSKNGKKKKRHVSVKGQMRSLQRLLNKVGSIFTVIGDAQTGFHFTSQPCSLAPAQILGNKACFVLRNHLVAESSRAPIAGRPESQGPEG